MRLGLYWFGLGCLGISCLRLLLFPVFLIDSLDAYDFKLSVVDAEGEGGNIGGVLEDDPVMVGVLEELHGSGFWRQVLDGH